MVTVGVGAMNSPRYAPAGLLVAHQGVRVLLDGGPGAEAHGHLDAWLLTDDHAELAARTRALARARGLTAHVGTFESQGLRIEPCPVAHTGHPTVGYKIRAAGRPDGGVGAGVLGVPGVGAGRGPDVRRGVRMARPIRFAGGVGGHLDALHVVETARRLGVRRLVLAHIGRPTIRALDRGERPPFGEVARDGQVFRLTAR